MTIKFFFSIITLNILCLSSTAMESYLQNLQAEESSFFDESQEEKKQEIKYISLHDAAKVNNCDAIKIFFNEGVNPNAYDKNGYTPLHYAIDRLCENAVELLCAYGADPKLHDQSKTITPLMMIHNKTSSNRLIQRVVGGQIQYFRHLKSLEKLAKENKRKKIEPDEEITIDPNDDESRRSTRLAKKPRISFAKK
jgi:hypothetical protein